MVGHRSRLEVRARRGCTGVRLGQSDAMRMPRMNGSEMPLGVSPVGPADGLGCGVVGGGGGERERERVGTLSRLWGQENQL